MNNLVVALYLFFALSGTCILVLLFLREQEKRFVLPLSGIVFILVLWSLFSGLSYYPSLHGLESVVIDLESSLVGYVVVAVYFFVIRFYSIDRYYRPQLALILCALPSTLLFLAQLNSLSGPDAGGAPQFWNRVNIVFDFAVLLAAFLVAFFQYKRIPQMYKKASRLLMIGLAPLTLGILTDTLIFHGSIYHRSVTGGIIAGVLFYIAARLNIGLDYLNVSRGLVYNELDDAIFILDSDGNIVNRNVAAKYLLFCEGLDISIQDMSLVLAKVFGVGDLDLPAENRPKESEYSITVKAKNEKVYNIQEKQILDNGGGRIGQIFICTDVTAEYEIITRIQLQTGIDPLTGVLTRDLLQQRFAEINRPERLPIGIIFGDLNGLKKINDTMGHHYGDILIRSAADALVKCAPPKADVFRFGGDEFVVMIPNYNLEECSQLVSNFTSYLCGDRFRTPVEISFGYEIRSALDEPLEEVIERADAAMYRNKPQNSFIFP